MNFILLEEAAAGLNAGAEQGSISMWPMLISIILLFGLMYLLLMRPQKKREKKANEMRNSIEIGDEITTIGGIVGRVVSIKEDTFIIETGSERTRMRFKRWAIQDVDKLNLEGDAPEPTDNKLKNE